MRSSHRIKKLKKSLVLDVILRLLVCCIVSVMGRKLGRGMVVVVKGPVSVESTAIP
jgi:hypothetical protein